MSGYTTYKLQPGEHDYMLEVRFGWPHGTIKTLNPTLDMNNIPNYYDLVVPALAGGGGVSGCHPTPGGHPTLGGNSSMQGCTTYKLQPGEHDYMLEVRFSWPHGTIKTLKPTLDMNNIPNYYDLVVPAPAGGGWVSGCHPTPGGHPTLGGNSSMHGCTTYKLQPGEHGYMLEERFGWPHGTIQTLNPNLDMNNIPNYYDLVVPAPAGGGGVSGGHPTPQVAAPVGLLSAFCYITALLSLSYFDTVLRDITSRITSLFT